MNKDETRFFSIGCRNCGSFQFGEGPRGGDSIPVFPSRILAQLALDDWQDEEEAKEHPPVIIEIAVKIL
jgi:hypothetical protein